MHATELKRGVQVFVILAVLTVIEYFLALSDLPAVFLWIVAILKAAAVVWFFMHINRLFNPDKGGNE